MPDPIRILVVDDSALVRKIITDILESDPMIEVVGTANNGKTAIFRNKQLDPDIITMDIEMPIMDGLAALKYIVENNPKPVIMVSTLTQHGADATFKALDCGAVDFIPKPSSVLSISVDEIGELLISKVKSVYKSKIKIVPSDTHISEKSLKLEKTIMSDFNKGSLSSKVVGIGTSTGGPSALLNIFGAFPENFPSPVVVVQHMPGGFTKAFSERLNGISKLTVKEGEDGDILKPGCGYIARGDFQMEIKKVSGNYLLKVYDGEKVSGHKPSIDVMFKSMASAVKKDSIAVIMTGMGRDGAKGIEKIKQIGGYTIAQNEKTSVVYGMNRVAVELGAIKEVVELSMITKKIVDQV